MQIKNKFPKIIVAVDADRVRGIKKLMQLPEKPEVIILDDGFQHRYVKADINIMLIDYNRPIYEDHLLPLGRLRESIHAKDRANYIIVTKCPANISPIEKRIILKHLNFHEIRRTPFAGREQSSCSNPKNGHTLCHGDCPTDSLRGIFKTDDGPNCSHHIS